MHVCMYACMYVCLLPTAVFLPARFVLFVCFEDRIFSLGFVPSALLNSPIAILKVTPPQPAPSQEKRRVKKPEHTGKVSRSDFK